MIGNDGGVAISWDMTKTWNFVPNLPVGLFYHVSYDMATPYNVCGGMQDNYNWCGPSAVRGAAGIANYQLGDDAGRRRLRRAAGSDRLPHRLQRVAGRQHGPHRSRHRRDDLDPAAAERRRAGAALELGHAARPCRRTIRRSIYAPANKVFRSANRGLNWETDQRRSHQQRQPRRHRDDGREGQRHPRSRRTTASQAWPTIISFAESPKRAGRALRRHRRRPPAGVARRRHDRGPTSIDKIPGLPKGIWVSRGRAVAVRRRHGLRDVRRPPAERLRDLHLRRATISAQTWQSVVGEPEGRGRSRR